MAGESVNVAACLGLQPIDDNVHSADPHEQESINKTGNCENILTVAKKVPKADDHSYDEDEELLIWEYYLTSEMIIPQASSCVLPSTEEPPVRESSSKVFSVDEEAFGLLESNDDETSEDSCDETSEESSVDDPEERLLNQNSCFTIESTEECEPLDVNEPMKEVSTANGEECLLYSEDSPTVEHTCACLTPDREQDEKELSVKVESKENLASGLIEEIADEGLNPVLDFVGSQLMFEDPANVEELVIKNNVDASENVSPILSEPSAVSSSENQHLTCDVDGDREELETRLDHKPEQHLERESPSEETVPIECGIETSKIGENLEENLEDEKPCEETVSVDCKTPKTGTDLVGKLDATLPFDCGIEKTGVDENEECLIEAEKRSTRCDHPLWRKMENTLENVDTTLQLQCLQAAMNAIHSTLQEKKPCEEEKVIPRSTINASAKKQLSTPSKNVTCLDDMVSRLRRRSASRRDRSSSPAAVPSYFRYTESFRLKHATLPPQMASSGAWRKPAQLPPLAKNDPKKSNKFLKPFKDHGDLVVVAKAIPKQEVRSIRGGKKREALPLSELVSPVHTAVKTFDDTWSSPSSPVAAAKLRGNPVKRRSQITMRLQMGR